MITDLERSEGAAASSLFLFLSLLAPRVKEFSRGDIHSLAMVRARDPSASVYGPTRAAVFVMHLYRLIVTVLVLPVLIACGEKETDPAAVACGALPQEEESVSNDRAREFGLFDGPLNCVSNFSVGSIRAQFYEDGSFESSWHAEEEPVEGLEGWSIPREEGAFRFEDGRIVALGTSTNGFAHDPFIGKDEFVLRSEGDAIYFHKVEEPLGRVTGSGGIEKSRFENSTRIWDFGETLLDTSLYNDEFDDWHDEQYEFRIDGETLFLSQFAEVGRPLDPRYLITLEEDCLKRAEHRARICTPTE